MIAMATGTDGSKSPPPTYRYESGRLVTGEVETAKVAPLNIMRNARVWRNGFTPKYATEKPLSEPMNPPIHSIRTIPSIPGVLGNTLPIRAAVAMAEKLATDPIERSKFPLIRQIDSASASIPSAALESRRNLMFETVRNDSGRKSENARKVNIKSGQTKLSRIRMMISSCEDRRS